MTVPRVGSRWSFGSGGVNPSAHWVMGKDPCRVSALDVLSF